MTDDRALLQAAAREAGALMLSMRGLVRVRSKADGSPVTDADLAVDQQLRAMLTTARPDYGWLSEESENDPARLACERVFVVDPIDGTSAYMKSRPWFAVSLAVVERGRPVAGVVFAPALDEFYAAAEGRGATLNGAPIRASARAELEGAAFVGDARLYPEPAWPPLRVERRNALAYRLALVAAGTFDAAVAPTPKWEWDLAAGVIIAAEAGAAVCDGEGRPLVFNTPSARTPGLVACAPALLPLILSRTARNGRATISPQR